MTDKEYNQFCQRVSLTTNFCCVVVLWMFRLPSWPACVALAVMLLNIGHGMYECRKAQRRYEKAVKDYMDAGGMVMLVKRGRRYYPVPVPLLPRDLS